MNAFLILALVAQTQTLTVHEAVDESLRRHPTLTVAQANTARAHATAREVAATRLPQLSLESSLTYFEEPMVVAPLHRLDPRFPPVFDETLAQGSLSLAYTLFDASRNNRIDRTEALASAAAAQADAARAQVISETVRAFLQVRSQRQTVEAQSHHVSALQRERDRAAQLVEQGKAARVVLLRAEAGLSAAQAEAVAAISELDVANQDLARLLGVAAEDIQQTELVGVAARAVVMPRDSIIAAAELRNPELRRLRMQAEAARSERSAAKGTWWPRVQVGGRFIDYASAATSPQLEWQGGAQLSYPIYTGGARGAAVDRASAEATAAFAEVSLGRRRVAENVDRALTAVRSTAARAASLESAVAQWAEVTRIDQLALQAGAGVQTDYLIAEANLFRMRASLTDARAAEVFAKVELARVSGELTTEWLAAHLENVR